MSLLNLYTNTIIISRLSAISGDKTAYSTITASEIGCIQRMKEEKTLGLGGAIGKMFRLYTEECTDIQKGDKLVDEDSNEYKVVAVTIPSELGNFVHKECVITLVN